MTTNMYLGFPFGVISVFLHTLLLCVDDRRSFFFYNASLFLWVCGNFIWMTIEFTAINPSSDIHWGPPVPTGGISDYSIYVMTQAKTVMFLFGFLIQIALYVAIYCKLVPMPEQENEDIVIRNEATLFLLGRGTFRSATNNVDAIMDLDEELPDYQELGGDGTLNTQSSDAAPLITLALIEYGYIVFWISKDLFWSFGTGELNTQHSAILAYEALAMCAGFIALCIYLVTAYIYRRRTLRFMDSLTTIFWISANYVWMCGEFFIRYHNLQFDDAEPGNDRETRIASAVLFCLGGCCQVYVVVVLFLRYREKRHRHRGATYTVAHNGAPKVDIKCVLPYETLATSISPHHHQPS